MFLLMLNLEIYGIVVGLYFLFFFPYCDEEYMSWMKLSDLNFWMVMLVVMLYLMMMSVETGMKFSMNLLFFFLLVIMVTSSLISFFLMYEMVFILIMFSILILGYSFERLMAGFMMMFYSFMFSSPTLMMLMVFDYSFLIKSWLNYSFILNYFLVGSFMVKFPIFGFHYWLPVAHVEASTVGSMILAGILLKLGSVGLLYLVSYLSFMVKFHWMSFAVPILMLMILSMSDLKIMIAYSSVAHMSMVFYIMMMGSFISKKGSLMMMFYHGIISPLMFWVVGMLAWWKTRSLMVIKFIVFSYVFILLLFFLLILNMGFPPFLGFMSEILMLKSLINLKLTLYLIISSVLFSCYYNIYLFWCFSNFMGMIFKMNFYMLDVYMFLFIIILLNIY